MRLRAFFYTQFIHNSFRSFSQPFTRAKGKLLELTSKFMQTEERKNKFFRIAPTLGRGKNTPCQGKLRQGLDKCCCRLFPCSCLPAFGSHLRRSVCRNLTIFIILTAGLPDGRFLSSRPFPPFPPGGGLSTPCPRSRGYVFRYGNFILITKKVKATYGKALTFFLY